MTSEEKRDLCCRFIRDKKGLNTVCLDLRKVTTVADFFVVCTGEVDVHVKAIADAVTDGMREYGERPWHREGYEEKRWILIDFVDVVIHVFCGELRNAYELEKLWGDAVLTTAEE